MPDATEQADTITAIAAQVTQRRQADVYFFAGAVERCFAERFCQLVFTRGQRPNALLLLTTFGGAAAAAYQMARCLQHKYGDGDVAVLVKTFCKSAGTLLTLGAKRVVMADCAELGPLDVQISKPDTLGERTSGLTPGQSLSTLRVEAFQCFEKFFLDILASSGFGITTRTAALIAAKVTSGLYGPVYAQIDPMRLGEFQRATQIALEYGKRLDAWSRNLKERALARLINGYPSHEFVIDRKEAATLFNNVEPLAEAERQLTELLAHDATRGAGGNNADIRYLSPEVIRPEDGSGVPSAAPRARRRTPRTRTGAARNGSGNGSRTGGDGAS